VRIEYLRLGLTAALAVVLGLGLMTDRPTEQKASSGHLLFLSTGCIGCHRTEDTSPTAEIGPSLIGLADRAGSRVPGLLAVEYVTQSIRQPQSFTVPGYGFDTMPTFDLTDAEVDSLVEYLLAG